MWKKSCHQFDICGTSEQESAIANAAKYTLDDWLFKSVHINIEAAKVLQHIPVKTPIGVRQNRIKNTINESAGSPKIVSFVEFFGIKSYMVSATLNEWRLQNDVGFGRGRCFLYLYLDFNLTLTNCNLILNYTLFGSKISLITYS